MIELSTSNLADYFRERAAPAEPIVVRELADGVSNAVFRIETPDRVVVLKQARAQLRTREAWYSDLGRIWRERDAMVLLRPLLPSGVVPEILDVDEANYCFTMSHAPEPNRNWRSVLLAGEVDTRQGELAGSLLAQIHGRTSELDLSAFADRTVFEQLRVDPFYVRVSERRPDLRAHIEPLIARCRSQRLALCHGDFSPKNLLLHSHGFTLVDYETAHWGDAAFDLGFFLSHLLLKSVHCSGQSRDFFDLTRSFWHGYAPEAEIFSAGIQHLAGCLMARIDGTSPAPYLTDEGKRESVRRIARRILSDQPRDWDIVLTYVREESS